MVKHYFHLYSFALLEDVLVPPELCDVILEIIDLLLHHGGHELHRHHLCMDLSQVFLSVTESCF